MNPFDAAEQDLKKHGHHEGGLYADDETRDTTSPACLLGSIMRVGEGIDYGILFGSSPIAKLLDEVVKEQYPDRANFPFGTRTVAAFNDHEDTTLDDIFTVLHKASVVYDEKAGLA